jgi:hypothetical protein
MANICTLSSRTISGLALGLAVLLSPMQTTGVVMPAMATEKPVAAEKNPPGDIPDSQVFIDYNSKLGFTMKVPEGWARSDRADGASFIDKLYGSEADCRNRQGRRCAQASAVAAGRKSQCSESGEAAFRKRHQDRLYLKLRTQCGDEQAGPPGKRTLPVLQARQACFSRALRPQRCRQCRPMAADVSVLQVELSGCCSRQGNSTGSST